MFDAVHVVVGAVRELNRSQEIGVKPLSCTSPQIWQHGTSLMNYLRMVNPPAHITTFTRPFYLLWTHVICKLITNVTLPKYTQKYVLWKYSNNKLVFKMGEYYNSILDWVVRLGLR